MYTNPGLGECGRQQKEIDYYANICRNGYDTGVDACLITRSLGQFMDACCTKPDDGVEEVSIRPSNTGTVQTGNAKPAPDDESPHESAARTVSRPSSSSNENAPRSAAGGAAESASAGEDPATDIDPVLVDFLPPGCIIQTTHDGNPHLRNICDKDINVLFCWERKADGTGKQALCGSDFGGNLVRAQDSFPVVDPKLPNAVLHVIACDAEHPFFPGIRWTGKFITGDGCSR